MQTQQVIEPTIINPEAVTAIYRRRPGTDLLVRQAIRLVLETFPRLESLTIQAVQDSEEDSEWLRLTVTARLDSAELQRAYYAYLERWVRETPPDMRHFVRMIRREA
jgi:hypothetical protein